MATEPSESQTENRYTFMIHCRHFTASAVFSLVLILLASAPAVAQWRMREFVIYLCGSPQVADIEAKASALRDAGFTVVDWDLEQIGVLRRFGLRGMIHNATTETASRLADDPAVWGYHCDDEPYPETEFLPLATRFKKLKEADPNHPAFVNMLSTTGEFLRTYMDVVQPQILSFDYYQWWWGSDRYFEKLEQFREAAMLANVPLGSCVEVTANPGFERGDTRYLPDNGLKLRQSVYTNLAYGVKAVEWFSADALFKRGSVVLTRAGRDVAELNRELKQVGKTLVKLRSLDVYHTPPLPAGTRSAPKEHWVHLIGEEGKAGLVLGAKAQIARTKILALIEILTPPQKIQIRPRDPAPNPAWRRSYGVTSAELHKRACLK